MVEDYVSFVIAKLLKEKGFDIPTERFYNECGTYCCGASAYNWNDDDGEDCSRPTLQMTMKWLREVHSLYIDIVTSFSQDGICYTFSCSNTMDLIQGTKGTSYHEYQTYEEAAEAGIRYCLENLI